MFEREMDIEMPMAASVQSTLADDRLSGTICSDAVSFIELNVLNVPNRDECIEG
jgi:hypothetical protein